MAAVAARRAPAQGSPTTTIAQWERNKQQILFDINTFILYYFNTMKQKLEQLSKTAMDIISTFARKGDAASIARIAGTASRIQQLQEQLFHIEQEIPQIDEKLKNFTLVQAPPEPRGSSADPFTLGNGRAEKKKLRITIDWARLGKPGGKEVICEHMSSHTMTKWAARLYQQFGPETLQKLAGFRISRGPMLSKNPQSDFLNKTSGTVFAHQPIGDSGYYILTHSQNSQKVTDIRRACQRVLSLPVGTVLVEEIEKNGW
jgi:hypothetical protein